MTVLACASAESDLASCTSSIGMAFSTPPDGVSISPAPTQAMHRPRRFNALLVLGLRHTLPLLPARYLPDRRHSVAGLFSGWMWKSPPELVDEGSLTTDKGIQAQRTGTKVADQSAHRAW